MSSRHRLAALALTLTMLVPLATAAQEPSREELEVASKHFQAGAEQYTAGDYSKAIVEFLKAYNAVPNALFLYNISLSYGKLGNVEDALGAALKAQAGVGMDEETANRNVGRIAAYERWQTGARAATEMAREASQNPQQVRVDAGRPSVAQAKSRIGVLGYTGVAVGVVGVGLVAGAGVVATRVKSDIATYERAAREGDSRRYEQLRADLDSRQTTGKILLFSGAGFAATGLVLLLLDAASGPAATTTNVIVSPDGAGASISLSF